MILDVDVVKTSSHGRQATPHSWKLKPRAVLTKFHGGSKRVFYKVQRGPELTYVYQGLHEGSCICLAAITV
jgi:hypothetical protein